jgi:hypothetical protein
MVVTIYTRNCVEIKEINNKSLLKHCKNCKHNTLCTITKYRSFDLMRVYYGFGVLTIILVQ